MNGKTIGNSIKIKLKSHRLLFRIILILPLLTGLLCCSHPISKSEDIMNHVESILHAQPDSALRLISTIDSNTLTRNQERARYALLKSIVLDKNNIDVTDFNILQPAIDYYEKNGDADERLKTTYYRGRIYINRGDYNNAIKWLLRALKDSSNCKDKDALAKLYVACGSMYYREYEIDSYIKNNIKAANLYKSLNDTIKYIRSCSRIFLGALLNKDKVLALKYKDICEEYSDKWSQTGYPIQNLAITYNINYGTKEDIENTIEKYNLNDNFIFASAIQICYGLTEIGRQSEALKFLELSRELLDKEKGNLDDSIKYYSIATLVYENNDMCHEALDAYKNYVETFTIEQNILLNSGLLFAEEKHKIEVEEERKATLQVETQIITFIVLLTIIVFIIIVSLMLRNNKLRKAQIRKSKNELNLEYDKLYLKNEKLTLEKDNLELTSRFLKEQVKILETEKNQLELLLKSDNELKPDINAALLQRLELLDGLMKSIITGNKIYSKDFRNIEDTIRNDREKFLVYLYDSLKNCYPQLIKRCEVAGLTDSEVKFVCLMALGLNNKEIGAYIELSRINVMASEIRKKLGLPKNISTLRNFINGILNRDNFNKKVKKS